MNTPLPAQNVDPLAVPVKGALADLLAPVRDDVQRVKALFRRLLFFEQDHGEDAGDFALPEHLRVALVAFCVPTAERMGEHLARMEGKWLRASLAMLAARMGGEVNENAVRLAASLELIHAATLIHDDIVDGAYVRRGVTALHRSYGPTSSVLMGDYLFSKAFYLLTLTGSPDLMNMVARRTNEVCLGEIQQSVGAGNLDLGETEYLSLITYKTASLIAACVKGGAMLAGLPQEVVDAMNRFGIAFGIAFQIRDDVLDYAADADELGKTMLTDLRQGKVTLPLILLRERLRADDRLDVWTGLTQLPAEVVVELLHEEGCLVDANATCLDYARRAQDELDALPPPLAGCEPVQSLHRLCRFVVERGK